MDIKEIKQIIDLMKRSELSEFEIEEKDLKLRISRDSKKTIEANTPIAFPMVSHSQHMPQEAPVSIPPAAAPPAAGAAPVAEDANAKVIKSPMVGTFYRAASPESSAFVDKGSTVSNETIVCIIEAMKVMNEIQSEVSGKITEILVENGQSVEYGQPLFKVK